MSGSSPISCSAFLAVASVTPIAVPSGSRISKNNSVRVEVGKNCCWTRPKPATAITNINPVAPTTAMRCEHHRDNPGGDESETHDPEYSARVFSRTRTGEPYRQKSCGRDKGAGQ